MISYFVCLAISRSGNFFERGAAIAPWICLCLPSSHPRCESQAHHIRFYRFIFELCHLEKTIINEKEAAIGPFKKHFWTSLLLLLYCRAMKRFIKAANNSFVLLRPSRAFLDTKIWYETKVGGQLDDGKMMEH